LNILKSETERQRDRERERESETERDRGRERELVLTIKKGLSNLQDLKVQNWTLRWRRKFSPLSFVPNYLNE